MLQIASASVVGRDHIGPGKNNQDAVCVERYDKDVIAVVCDGCGSSAHSEVGAKIGAKLIASAMERRLRLSWDVIDEARRTGGPRETTDLVNAFLERVQADVLAQIRVLANAMGDSLTAVVQDCFLFTVVGAVVTPEIVFVFGCGDGVAILNGLDLKIGLTDGTNAPPYIGYHLVGQGRGGLTMKAVLQGGEFDNLVIATDGLEALMANPDAKIPGKTETVGLVSRLWEDDKLFANQDALRRFLALANRTVETHDWKAQAVRREHGLLKDDTSLVVIRRNGNEVPAGSLRCWACREPVDSAERSCPYCGETPRKKGS
jgi:hypothetical protein